MNPEEKEVLGKKLVNELLAIAMLYPRIVAVEALCHILGVSAAQQKDPVAALEDVRRMIEETSKEWLSLDQD